jgi:hypothetical protein
MNIEENDPVDRAIDEALASMVGGEPRRLSGASIRQAAGESRRSSLPMWLAAAAGLIVALALALKGHAPVLETSVGVAQAVPSPAPVEVRSTPSPESTQALPTTLALAAASRPSVVPTTTEPVYEGLPRLAIASIDLPEPLRPARIDADPLQVPRIEIAPLAVSSLSNEQEHK